MVAKPQGFPFLFYGREPGDASELTYGIELAAPIAFASRADVALDEAFRTAVHKDGASHASLYFDASAPTRVKAVIVPEGVLAPSVASKLVVRGLLAMHAIAPIVECVHLASRGRGESAWDTRSREVREQPSAELLAVAASMPAGDPLLASATVVAVAPPAPAMEIQPVKALPRRASPSVLDDPDPPLAAALDAGKVSVGADGERAVWFHAGLIAERPAPGQPSRVIADLGSLPARLTLPWAAAAIVDGSRIVVVSRRLVILLAEGRGLHHPVSVAPLALGVHDVAVARGLAIVGSASEASPDATLSVLGIDGHVLVPLASEPISSELWGKRSDIDQLEPIAIDDRVFTTARFSSKGRRLRIEGLAEVMLRSELVRPAETMPSSPASEGFPLGASVARPLEGGGFVALVPTLTPVSESRMVVPMHRRVVRVLPDGTTRDYALPSAGYSALALSPDRARFVVVAAHGHGQQRLVVDVESGEILSVRERIGECAAFLDDDRVLVGTTVERWRDGVDVARIAGSPWRAEVDRERSALVVLENDGTLARFAIEAQGVVPLGAFAALGGRPAALRESGRGVEPMVHGTWRPVL